MSKNFLRKYEDGFFDEDELEGVEKLRHHINKQEKEIEKKQTIRRKKNRREKDIELESREV